VALVPATPQRAGLGDEAAAGRRRQLLGERLAPNQGSVGVAGRGSARRALCLCCCLLGLVSTLLLGTPRVPLLPVRTKVGWGECARVCVIRESSGGGSDGSEWHAPIHSPREAAQRHCRRTL
jgi:hypothetical protein